jgi:predicted PurR-regulated permease PerM
MPPQDMQRVRTIGIAVLAGLAVIGALYVGGEFLIPIAFAMCLNALLRPVVRGMEKLRVPAPAGAAAVVLAIMALMLASGWLLAGPIKGWVRKAPQSLDAAEAKLARYRGPMQQVSDVADKIERVTQGPSTQPSPAPQAAQPVQPAVGQPPGVATRFLGTTTKIVGGITEVLLLLYLILAGGGMFLDKLVRLLPRRDKQGASDVVHESEAVVLRYIWVTAVINLCQGALIVLVMWWLKMPTPVLWGIFTFVLEFVPYLGAAAMIGLLSITAFATFDSIGHILLAPGCYLVITTLQNNLVSPIAYGNGLKLNPVAVLIGVIFWWFVWGIPGAFLAVPILATIRIVALRHEILKPVAEFLGE